VRHVAKKIFGWKLSYEEETEDWDVFWTDSAVQPEKLAKMRHYQRINHFPGMYLVSRKNYLAFNLGKLRKLFPSSYNFFPKTWVVPCDMSDLKGFMLSKKNPYVIVKPEASCQGRGIYLTKKIEDINSDEKHVVQEYLTKPYLIDDLKFDLRIYVLVTSCEPLRIFVHEDGLTRFATEEYEKPNASNIEDMCMHLTNYAINKNNPNFIHNEDPDCDDIGHKRSLKSTYEHLESEGFDVAKLKSRIDDIIIKTLCAVQPNLSHHYRSCQPEDYSRSMCFEILGLDVIIDKKLNPYILEVNHTPSFTTDSPLDRSIKKRVISEALTLVDVSLKNKKKYLKKLKEDIFKRSMTGKLERMSKEEKDELIKKLSDKRDKFEAKNLGGYRKIYPVEGSDKYNQFIEAADNIWQEWTGAKKARMKREEAKSPVMNKPAKTLQSFAKPRTQYMQKRMSDCENIDRPSSTIFERLSQPIIRKYRSTTAGYFPGVVYDDKKENKREVPTTITLDPEKLIERPAIPDRLQDKFVEKFMEKPPIKPRVFFDSKHSTPNKPASHRHVAVSLKELLTGRPSTLQKNRYIDFLLRNK
jgi:tubulin polyglutamylase TTLL6/13